MLLQILMLHLFLILLLLERDFLHLLQNLIHLLLTFEKVVLKFHLDFLVVDLLEEYFLFHLQQDLLLLDHRLHLILQVDQH